MYLIISTKSKIQWVHNIHAWLILLCSDPFISTWSYVIKYCNTCIGFGLLIVTSAHFIIILPLQNHQCFLRLLKPWKIYEIYFDKFWGRQIMHDESCGHEARDTRLAAVSHHQPRSSATHRVAISPINHRPPLPSPLVHRLCQLAADNPRHNCSAPTAFSTTTGGSAPLPCHHAHPPLALPTTTHNWASMLPRI